MRCISAASIASWIVTAGASWCPVRAIPRPTHKSRQLLKPSGQRCRLRCSGPALFEGNEQGLALVTETKARELLTLSGGGLPSQFAPADTVKLGGTLLQKLSMDRILLPPGCVGYTTPVAQQ